MPDAAGDDEDDNRADEDGYLDENSCQCHDNQEETVDDNQPPSDEQIEQLLAEMSFIEPSDDEESDEEEFVPNIPDSFIATPVISRKQTPAASEPSTPASSRGTTRAPSPSGLAPPPSQRRRISSETAELQSTLASEFILNEPLTFLNPIVYRTCFGSYCQCHF